MPERLAYDEAMRASAFRLQIQDQDLKEGHVEMMTIHAVTGSYPRPWGLQGGFAIVYKFCTKSGQFRALRCFLKQIDKDTQFIYGRIGPYFHTHIAEITAGFRYHDPGILVSVQGQAKKVSFPIIEMEWIEGAVLQDKVNDLCIKRERAALEQLCVQWLDLLQKLRQAHIAHGDLAASNVLVRPDGKLVLIDYDGVYIPEFAGKLKKQGGGQADYQHPQMDKRPFTEHMDDFSALVIYTALLAVASTPELWGRYMKVDPKQGKLLDSHFLFTHQDFTAPAQSPLIQELQHHPDQRVQDAVKELVRACKQPVDAVRFPLHIIDPEYEKKQALKLLRSALQSRDVSAIAATYTPNNVFFQDLSMDERQEAQAAHTFVQVCAGNDDVALLAAQQTIDNLRTFQPFVFNKQQRERIKVARDRAQALTEFRTAVTSKNIRRIATAYNTVLDKSTVLSGTERDLYALCSHFIQAYDAHKDDALDTVYQALQTSSTGAITLTNDEKQRIEDIRARKAALQQFRAALQQARPQDIIAAYKPILDGNQQITQQEQTQLGLARLFVQAFTKDDDNGLLNLKQEMQQKNVTFSFTSQEQQRLDEAIKRATALETFRKAWNTQQKQPDTLLNAYDATLLSSSKAITKEQHQRLQDARDYMVMYREVQLGIQTNDNDAIRRAFNKQLHQAFSIFTSAEEQRIASATQTLEVQELLNKKAYEQAILLAQSIVRSSREEIDDFLKLGLHTATMRFVRTQDITSVRVQLQEDRWNGVNTAEVLWHWSQNTLIRNALIVWRTDTWPQRPSERNWQDPEWHHIEVLRANLDGNYVHEGRYSFSIGRATHIYVKMFASILDTWDHDNMQWYYADGNDPTSQDEAGSDRIPWQTYG